MIIECLKTNHIETPLGYQIARPVFSWTVSSATGKRQASTRVKVAADAAMSEILFDTGERDDLTSLGVPADLALAPRTRYFWQVSVTADDGEKGLSPVSWFETGKMDEPFLAKWIAAPFDGHPVLSKEFVVGSAPAKTVAAARLYICGLGLYEAYLDGEKIGSEHLAPGYDSYQHQIQLQTYDVTGALKASGDAGAHTLSVMLGKGWYMGRYGFGKEIANIYGDRMQLLAELHIAYEDGTSDVIASDESWLCTPSPVVEANLYDGEIYDARVKAFSTENAVPAVAVPAPQGGLIDRIGLPVEVQESWSEYDLIKTPAGELVLDFHQNLAGFVTFTCDLPAGEQVYLQFGELLQDGCFYRDNLRTAKAEYTYISSGEKSFVRPIFTFYGFRYVKVQGLTEEQIRAAGFTVCAIWSALEATGSLTTSDPGLNRLILNALWSQRGNFVDIPTDCPQRDERMGWTGDAQAFSETASLFMYTPVFYAKYLSDMLYEQKTLGGSVPFVVPDALTLRGGAGMDQTNRADGSCAWGDAATVIPWNLYRYYGDAELLAQTYPNMKLWTDYIRHEEETNCGGRRLWQCGFHFADWLSLDNPDKSSPMGGTDEFYVATCYYYLSASYTANAALVLADYVSSPAGENMKGGLTAEEYEADSDFYRDLAEEIRAAWQKEYVAPDGSLKIDTQTAYVLALHLDLLAEDDRPKAIARLRQLLAENNDHLTTGFVGTYQLCPTLTEIGMTDLAYKLLFHRDFPSWLYEVDMGATTIWERWNSVLPDGHVSDTGMNSMNHYCYGSIVQWMFQTITGLAPDDTAPGFKRAVIAPQPDSRLSFARCSYRSAAGVYKVGWERVAEGGAPAAAEANQPAAGATAPDGTQQPVGLIRLKVAVPFDAEALLFLPDGTRKLLDAGEYEFEFVG